MLRRQNYGSLRAICSQDGRTGIGRVLKRPKISSLSAVFASI
ncbi:hypothetical protein GGD52_003959, partial [Agrobacterium tumefaciens]|nr:hypothetical protein [Agrobacterium radiobacter]MBB5589336.1 hypothetical protein [Agrobacterium radiobacter]